MKADYYVLKLDDGGYGRVAKKEDALWYGWEKSKWIEMPDLAKIEFDVTDYVEISKEEADRITKYQEKHWK